MFGPVHCKRRFTLHRVVATCDASSLRVDTPTGREGASTTSSHPKQQFAFIASRLNSLDPRSNDHFSVFPFFESRRTTQATIGRGSLVQLELKHGHQLRPVARGPAGMSADQVPRRPVFHWRRSLHRAPVGLSASGLDHRDRQWPRSRDSDEPSFMRIATATLLGARRRSHPSLRAASRSVVQ